MYYYFHSEMNNVGIGCLLIRLTGPSKQTMDKKMIKTVLLIDDDHPTNFLHTRTIRKSGRVEKVISVHSAEEGLAYLNTKNQEDDFPKPDMIFLDINMPGMNGWEFLQAYEQLPLEKRGDIVVVMLTTSLNPDDLDKAKTIAVVNDFQYKPLSVERIDELIEKHFLAIN